MFLLRIILHVDLNSFYASVEIAQDKSLKGIPIAVAGDSTKRNGVILTASYEARKFGVKAAMSNSDAKRLCPEIRLVPPRMKLYKQYSDRVMCILKQYTYKVEQCSIDEAWLDIGDIVYNMNDAIFLAKNIKRKIRETVGVTVSVGISYNKILAKMASDIAGVDDIYVINPEDLRNVIWKKPIKDLIGIGKKTEEKVNSLNIYSIGDLATANLTLIKAVLKKPGEQLWMYANGIDNSEVNYEESLPKSIGNSHTLREDTDDIREIEEMLLLLSEEVGFRIRSYKLSARTISITVKTKDFKKFTRQKTFIGSIHSTQKIYKEALLLFKENWDYKTKIRLIGVSVSGFEFEENQMSFLNILDNASEKENKLDSILDEINKKYDKHIISRASSMNKHKLYSFFDKQ